MSDLGDILAQRIAAAGTVPTSARQQAEELVQHFGSGRKAAKALGVNESTLRRIRSGKTGMPKSSTAQAIVQTLRTTRVDTERVKAGLPVGFKFDGRPRNLNFHERQPAGNPATNTLKPGTVDRMAAAYGRGDTDGIAQAFIDGVDDGWYQDRFEDAHGDMAEGTAGAGEGSDSVGAFS